MIRQYFHSSSVCEAFYHPFTILSKGIKYYDPKEISREQALAKEEWRLRLVQQGFHVLLGSAL